jgi:5,5'-dehydrodivanillate O-demethylase oxygenase subunit
MASRQPDGEWAETLELFTQTARGTPMGDLLRRFWQPVSLSSQVEPGKARAVRVFSEDLTLYRGISGQPYLVAGRCAHRCSRLHTGWVEGDDIRCVYHGWKYDGTGQCVEMPAENPSLPAKVKIASYPVHEHCGLVFAYLAPAPVPAFDLPRKDAFEEEGRLTFQREQVWPCSWFQQSENSMDAVHVSFVHQKGRVGIFGQAVTSGIPSLKYVETDAGIRQIATRGPGNVRVSDWTFPNNNHILVPGITKDHPWMDIAIWLVGIDDERTSRFQIYSFPSSGPEIDRKTTEHFRKHIDYNPSDHHEELFDKGEFPEEMALELVNAQDYVAVMGQGRIADRAGERLASSDAGVALLRRIFQRELKATCSGGEPKVWRRLHEQIELQSAEAQQAVRA